MHRSSLVRRPLGLLLGAALLALPQLTAARAADRSSKVSFDTVDGVTIQGTFFPGKGKDEPAVLLLHKLGGDSHKDGWDGLAEKLSEKGYNVLSFDFRGHGASTAIDPAKFWSRQFPFNARYDRTNGLDARRKPKEAINQKDFAPGYLPYLINDIAAAKTFLDERNDAGDCNSRALVVIGAEDGAALGAVWMYSEWNRHSATLNPINPLLSKVDPDVAGKDQYCAVWLTMTPALGGKINVTGALHTALRLVGKDKKIPMGFLYGEKDETGQKHAERFLEFVKGSDPKENKTLPFTDKQAVKGTKLAGSGLLRKELNTDGLILNYLTAVRDKNAPRKWGRIDADRTAYVWTFGPRPIIAKDEKAKFLEPLPLVPLGIAPQ